MEKRGAYFFVLDALIGGAIFLISVVIIMSSYVNTPQTSQVFTISEDLMNVIMNTKIIEFRHPYIQSLADRGAITNSEQSLFDQIAEFYYTNQSEEAHNLTKIIINSLLSEQFGTTYMITNTSNNQSTVIYNRSVERLNTSRMQLSTKKITFYAPNQSAIFGPDITELRIWN